MNSITLSRSPAKVLPTTVSIGGETYGVRTSFRTILNILRLIDDPDITDRHKHVMIVGLFYGERTPPIVEGYDAFCEFMRGRERRSDPEAAVIDYEFDADVIYASFMSAYRIDLLDPAFDLHWYAFTALLGGLPSDTALGERLSLRKLDTSKLKGKAKKSAEIAKKNAQPPLRVSEADKAQQTAIMEALREGRDPGALLKTER